MSLFTANQTFQRIFEKPTSLHFLLALTTNDKVQLVATNTTMSSGPYQAAASLLNDIWERRVSLKTLVYNKKGNLTCSKATYAQVCKVLANRAVLQDILETHPVDGAKNQGLLHVLVYELLMGPNKRIQGGGALKRKLMKKEEAYRKALVEAQVRHPADTTAVDFPRYVRVNTWRTTTKDVVDKLKQLGIECFADEHVPDLLVLPQAITGRLKDESSLLESSHIVLQDKSSCFSALCMALGFDEVTNRTGVDYLDACAAPGNKTSHLAALLANNQTPSSSGKKVKPTTVYALDRNSQRLDGLKLRMAKMLPAEENAHIKVLPELQDFLATTPADFSTCRGILLDPSCSGSGIFTALDRQADSANEEEVASRMEHLSNFQVTALKHAMTFPSVQHIVYSTCSIHAQENESVVEQAVNANRDDWKIVAPQCLTTWKRRGVATEGLSEEETDCMIRVDKEDDTNGFFVCCLQRQSATNQKAEKAKVPEVTSELAAIPVYSGQFKKAIPKKSPKKNTPKKSPSSTDSATKSPTPSKKDAPVSKSKQKRDNAKKNTSKPATPDAVETETTDVSTVSGNVVSVKSKKRPAETETTGDDKHANKRAKKLAWKSQQKSNKLNRIKKKKSA
jgi:putative methyltransferase